MARDLIVDVVAGGGPHHLRHALAVREALPETMRGAVWSYSSYLRGQPAPVRTAPPGNGDLFLVSSYIDMKFAAIAESRKPIIFTEHGAGFTFASIDGVTYSSYSGSHDRPNVVLFLNTNEYVQRKNAAAHPAAAQAIVGCPAMDPWYPPPVTPHARGEGPLTVALAWHWDCLVAPGTRSALGHYQQALPALAAWAEDRGYRLMMAAHPRIEAHAQMVAAMSGIPMVQLEDVFREADMLVADATSAMYEFASLDRPVLTLNCPAYRDEPGGNIRFWDYIPGAQVDGPAELIDGVERALEDAPELRAQRQAAVEAVYPIRGNAGAVAAAAIQSFIEDPPEAEPYVGPSERLRSESARYRFLRDRILQARHRAPLSHSISVMEYKDITRGKS